MPEKILTESERTAEEEKKLKERLTKEERARKSVEPYKMKRMSGMLLAPGLVFLVVFIYGVYEYLVNKNFDWGALGIVVVFGIAFSIASEIESDWNKRLECKNEMTREEKDSSWADYDYDDDYIYTDSATGQFLYQITKVAFSIITIISVIFIGIVLFTLLGSISIAPTTIIIILLVMILLNQNKN